MKSTARLYCCFVISSVLACSENAINSLSADSFTADSIQADQITYEAYQPKDIVVDTDPLTECPRSFDVTDLWGQEITLKYCSHLVNSKGLEIYFAYQTDKLLVYTVRSHDGGSYLLDSIFRSRHSFYSVDNLYSTGEGLYIAAFDAQTVTVGVSHSCPDYNDYCSVVTQDISNYYYQNKGRLAYYIAPEYFQDPNFIPTHIENAYNKDSTSLDYLSEVLGFFPPIEQIIQFSYLANQSISSSWGFMIENQTANKHASINSSYGNTHEFVHVYFYGTPVERSWFEEGLAEYLSQRQRFILDGYLHCREAGWENGYYNSNNEFVADSPFVLYSDFTVYPQENIDFYDPLNQASYYRSAVCFWKYIVDNYGIDTLQSIGLSWNNTRLEIPPSRKMLVRDIVNPVLGYDLSDLIKKRYNYSEE